MAGLCFASGRATLEQCMLNSPAATSSLELRLGPGCSWAPHSLRSPLSPCFSCPQVSAVPTVLAMKNGDVVDKFVGIKDEDQLEAFLKKLIGA